MFSVSCWVYTIIVPSIRESTRRSSGIDCYCCVPGIPVQYLSKYDNPPWYQVYHCRRVGANKTYTRRMFVLSSCAKKSLNYILRRTATTSYFASLFASRCLLTSVTIIATPRKISYCRLLSFPKPVISHTQDMQDMVT